MIKFFRKIRQKYLAENKIGKYLKYAVGEIILVAIGIFIALQVNNWNNKRLAEAEEYELLEEFKEELILDLSILKDCVADLKEDVLTKDKLFKINELESLNLDSLHLLIRDINVDVLPNQTIFEKVKNKNITKLTNNKDLNQDIFNYFNGMNNATKSINYYFDKHLERQSFFEQQNSIYNYNSYYRSIEIEGLNQISETEEKRQLIAFANTPKVSNLIKQIYSNEKTSAFRLDLLQIKMSKLLEKIQKELENTDPKTEPIPQKLLLPNKGVFIKQETMNKYVGKYEFSGLPIEILMDEQQLYFDYLDGRYYLVPLGNNKFDVKHSFLHQLEFEESKDGIFNAFTLKSLNDKFRYIKTETKANNR